MKTFTVRYTKTYDLDIQVQAEDQDQAKNKADEILNQKSNEILLEEAQVSYWDNWAVDEEGEEDDRND